MQGRGGHSGGGFLQITATNKGSGHIVYGTNPFEVITAPMIGLPQMRQQNFYVQPAAIASTSQPFTLTKPHGFASSPMAPHHVIGDLFHLRT